MQWHTAGTVNTDMVLQHLRTSKHLYQMGWHSGNILDLCLGGAQFEFHQDTSCSDRFFIVLLNSLDRYQDNTAIWPQPLPSRSFSVHSSNIIWHYVLATVSFIKSPNKKKGIQCITFPSEKTILNSSWYTIQIILWLCIWHCLVKLGNDATLLSMEPLVEQSYQIPQVILKLLSLIQPHN